MSSFHRYLGIDYSGARTAEDGLPGLRVYGADGATPPVEILPPPGPSRYWTRRGVAQWLVETLRAGPPALVGIDHAFSFPLRYFEQHGLRHDWPAFLDDFQRHWPTHEKNTCVDFVRDGVCGDGAARLGSARWRRLAEVRTRSAKSAFHFDVPGSVAKSTHAGLPWLRYVRCALGTRVHCWPFDGWTIPAGRHAIVEVYPSLWSRDFPRGVRTADQHDAYAVAAWLRHADRDGRLPACLTPALTDAERKVAEIEGWILGVG